jgi:hypothetical protein
MQCELAVSPPLSRANPWICFLCGWHRAVLAALHGAQPHAQEFGNRYLGADLPALAKTVAISAPMPREAPVTRALLPCRLNRLAWSGIG